MIAYALRTLRAVHDDETGAAILEYALFCAVVSVPAYLALMAFGQSLQTLFAGTSTNLTNDALVVQ